MSRPRLRRLRNEWRDALPHCTGGECGAIRDWERGAIAVSRWPISIEPPEPVVSSVSSARTLREWSHDNGASSLGAGPSRPAREETQDRSQRCAGALRERASPLPPISLAQCCSRWLVARPSRGAGRLGDLGDEHVCAQERCGSNACAPRILFRAPSASFEAGHARLVAPCFVIMGRPPPKRKRYRDVRSREYLTSREVDSLIRAVKGSGRNRHRNATLILVAYRHGLRAGEIGRLRWDQVDLEEGVLHVLRLKNGRPSTHPIPRVEARALRRLRRETAPSPFVFLSEQGRPMTPGNVYEVVVNAGRLAGLPFPAHPHMLRHACGYKLANDGHDTRAIQAYLGHQDINHTVRYTELTSDRFKGFWPD